MIILEADFDSLRMCSPGANSQSRQGVSKPLFRSAGCSADLSCHEELNVMQGDIQGIFGNSWVSRCEASNGGVLPNENIAVLQSFR